MARTFGFRIVAVRLILRVGHLFLTGEHVLVNMT
jgi:hypothetical protein